MFREFIKRKNRLEEAGLSGERNEYYGSGNGICGNVPGSIIDRQHAVTAVDILPEKVKAINE